MASLRTKTTPQTLVDKWNANHPAGTPVIRYRAMNPPREPVETTTQSEAFIYRAAACVMVEGVIGSVNLESLVPKAAPHRRTVSNSKTKKGSSKKTRVAESKRKKRRRS